MPSVSNIGTKALVTADITHRKTGESLNNRVLGGSLQREEPPGSRPSAGSPTSPLYQLAWDPGQATPPLLASGLFYEETSKYLPHWLVVEVQRSWLRVLGGSP